MPLYVPVSTSLPFQGSAFLTYSIGPSIEVIEGGYKWRAPGSATINGVAATLGTAPASTSMILDLNINGTTAYTTQGNRPTIAISGTLSTLTLPDVVDVVAGDLLTLDVDQTDAAAQNLVVVVSLGV